MNDENHKGWKLVSGVRRDVVKLFEMFGNTNSVRFEDFCKVWKELGFSLIFSNRNAFTELLEFSEEVLQIVKEYLLSVYEFHTRVAAVYTLYGLYFKQPVIGAAKIRFTKTEWEEAFAFTQLCKSAQHYDVAFIFMKLYLTGAFSFTATIRQAGLERGFRKYSEKKSTLHTKVCDVELLYRPLISEKLVNSLVKLESLYCRKKSELLGKRNLVFIDGRFAQSLHEELKNYKFPFQSQSQYNMKNKLDDSTEGAESQQNESTSHNTVHTEMPDATVLSILPECSKPKRNQRSAKTIDDERVPMKMRKFSKKYIEVLAKKKAEFYIQKLQLGNSERGSKESKPFLDMCELGDVSDTEIINLNS